MRDLLVTGTDTGVGKTVVASALITAMCERGVRALGFKPAETGIEVGNASDSELLARASCTRVALAAPLLQLREPLAPAVAAERAGVLLKPEDVESRVDQLRRAGFTLVIEGAGGVMVPLTYGYTVLDLAAHCDLDAVVVARAGLGTLNHVVMTVQMLRSRHIAIRGIVLNGRGVPPDLAESTNPSVLARLLPGVPIVEVPQQNSPTVIAATAAMLRCLL